MAKACWMCGKENAEYSFETERLLSEDELSEIISNRNRLRDNALYRNRSEC